MPTTFTCNTTVAWKNEPWCHLACGNDAEMDFSLPPDAHDLRYDDVSLGMRAVQDSARFVQMLRGRDEGIELDRTELFTQVVLQPKIRVMDCAPSCVHRALQSAQNYSLVANLIKSQILIEPEIEVVQ